jgi:hypothetical protein
VTTAMFRRIYEAEPVGTREERLPRVSGAERTRQIKEFLRRTPNVPHDSRGITSATGVPKSMIDYKQSLSSDPTIRREMFTNPRTGTRRVYWMYVGAVPQSSDLREPENLAFSPWRSWAERGKLKYAEDDQRAGVYLLSRFEGPMNGDVAPSCLNLPPEIFYIGLSKNLNNRPLTDHDGGKERYRDKYKEDPGFENLYVSVCPVFGVGCADESLMYSLIQYLEMKLAWQYTSRHRRPLHYKKR